MRMSLLLILLLPSLVLGLTVDTGHALYSNMKGIYVFEGASGSGSNLVGDGTMVGTVEDANGFTCPITQSYQSWYEDFGSGYTICIWHEGLDLASNYRAIVIIADRVAWFRNALQSHCRVRHGPTEYVNLADLTLASIADPMMLSLTHNTSITTQRAYDGNDLYATGGLSTAPTTSGAENDLQIPGDGVVTRLYIFDTELNAAQLGALEADPNSIFAEEAPAQASAPSPADEATGVSIETSLSWTGDANDYDVYFGVSTTDINSLSQGNTDANTYDPGTLEYATKYHWRVDPNDPNGLTIGNVWTFTTEAESEAPVPAPVAGWRQVAWTRQTGQWHKRIGQTGWRKQ